MYKTAYYYTKIVFYKNNWEYKRTVPLVMVPEMQQKTT